MSSALLDTIRDTFATEKAKARRTYAAIVRRADTPDAKPTDPKELRAAMATLGYSEDVLAADLAALAETRQLTASIPDGVDTWPDALADRHADRQRESAACVNRRAALMEQFRQCAQRERELAAEAEADERETRAKIDKVEADRARLADLRRSHALVLGDE